MRYIGNKTRLLPFILERIEKLGIQPGRAHDAFAGTASVGRALKERGWRVESSDLMTYSYVFQRAYVVNPRDPDLCRLLDGDPELRRVTESEAFRRATAGRLNGGTPSRRPRPGDATMVVAEYLSRWIDPQLGFLSAHFTPAGGRMYFTEQNAARLDAARGALHRWREADLIDGDSYYVFLAAVLEAADRVANTAGVYAAFIKEWQPNARRPVHIEPVPAVPGNGCGAHVGDAAAVARRIGEIDLLYVDPPYNTRQYAGYYHVPELIARGWFEGEPALRGKTGLVPDSEQRSDWCSRGRARQALEQLLSATGARHLLVSYNSEGILSREDMLEVLGGFSKGGKPLCFSRPYRRYRADRDRQGRRYKGSEVRELLFYARLR